MRARQVAVAEQWVQASELPQAPTWAYALTMTSAPTLGLAEWPVSRFAPGMKILKPKQTRGPAE